MLYSVIRFVHVATAILFLGNIVIGLFWKRRAERHGDVRTLATMLRVLAEGERRITLPAADASAARPGAEYRRISFWWELWGGASILAASLALALMVFRP